MNNKTISRNITAVLLAVCMLMLAGCKVKTDDNAAKAITITDTVTKDEKFGSAIIDMTLEQAQKLGFDLGDSCDIKFGNGYTITDVPFYNGYYVKNDEPVIVAYPGHDNISITYNNAGIWEQAKLSENESVTITLIESGKYSDIQDTLGQVYSTDRDDYASDIEFCNFRALTGGDLKADFLYRGASPVDNARGRAAYTDAILKEYEIGFIVDLADSVEDIAEYTGSEDFDSPYAEELIENGDAVLLDMGSAYQSEAYQQSVANGMRAMLSSDGPVYIHCQEGKDRTGFVYFLIEALAGADYEEMLNDYMATYNNYYSVTKEDTTSKYNAIADLYFNAFVSFLHGSEDLEELKAADYSQDAADYLRAGGMTDDEIEQLIDLITE